MKIVKESLNEVISFERKKDPLSALGIGKKALIKNWLDKMKIDKEYVTINKDFMIDATGLIDLDPENIREFPKYIQFNEIRGTFACSNCNLISLKGCPFYVTGNFYCHSNNLISLKYCPKRVDANFWCGDNKVQFTKEDVRKLCKVKGDIYV